MTNDTVKHEYIDLMYPEWKHSLISDIQKKDAERLKRSKFVQLISYFSKQSLFFLLHLTKSVIVRSVFKLISHVYMFSNKNSSFVVKK